MFFFSFFSGELSLCLFCLEEELKKEENNIVSQLSIDKNWQNKNEDKGKQRKTKHAQVLVITTSTQVNEFAGRMVMGSHRVTKTKILKGDNSHMKRKLVENKKKNNFLLSRNVGENKKTAVGMAF